MHARVQFVDSFYLRHDRTGNPKSLGVVGGEFPPSYQYVKREGYVQCTVGSDPNDLGKYGNSGTGFYMPSDSQMKQMIADTIWKYGGDLPKGFKPPKPTQLGVGAGGGE